jgi:transposase
MPQHPSVLGDDLAKRVWHVVGMAETGPIVLQKRRTRDAWLPCSAQWPPLVIGLEAWGGVPYWARCFREPGHPPQRRAPQLGQPSVTSNTKAPREAEAICDAVTRPPICFVPSQAVAQHDRQSLQRARARVGKARTARVHARRGGGRADGIVLPHGVPKCRQPLRATFEAEPDTVPPVRWDLWAQL